MVIDLVWDAVLVAGFGFQHSLLATIRTKKVVKLFSELDPLSWRAPQSALNVLYVVVAASLWRPVDVVLWDLSGATYWIFAGTLAFGWLWYFQIHIFEYDCGLAFGSTPIVNRALGRKSPALEMWTTGMRRWSRFPVHTAFFPMFLAFPTMTADLAILGVTAILYNIIGTILYDVRLKRLIGEPYQKYVDETGLMFPPVYRNLKGARDLDLPTPHHWLKPSKNLPGILLGLIAGLGYWQMLGWIDRTPKTMALSWGASFVVAIVGGALLGLLKRARLNRTDFDRYQTELSTNAALMSAIGIITWFALSLAVERAHPTLAAVLPMWLTVLWGGHAVSAFTVLVPLKGSSRVKSASVSTAEIAS